MVDDLTPQGSMPPVETPGAQGQKQGFLSTTTGKIVVIGAAVFAFLVVAGIVTFVVITFFFVDAVNDSAEQIANEIEQEQSETGSAEEATTSVALEPSPIPLSSIFTFRDIFNPLIDPTPAEETTGTTTDGTTTDGTTTDGTVTTPGEPDTLYLQDIVVENGVSKAVLSLNGVTYTLAEGQAITGTPWLVLNIYSGSVTMLYGDSQVTLVIGQGIASK